MGEIVGSKSGISSKNEYLVPDYYKYFSCKGKECRYTCCSGWKVTIPMNEYFKLHGITCNKKLRENIDRTFRTLPDFTPERYAEIIHNSFGECPLLLANGYCNLHSQLGEEVLPSVCRYYPRGPKVDYAFECSTTNSCERTLELLFETDDLISFEKRRIELKIPLSLGKVKADEKLIYESVRTFVFKILQDRTVSLPDRILKIGKVILELDGDIHTNLLEIDLSILPITKDIPYVYQIMENVASWFIEKNPNISPFFSDILSYLENKPIEEAYLEIEQHLSEVLPNHEIMFEKMLMNNLFFRQFPFQEFTSNFEEEFVYLCGAYLFTRYLSLGYMRDKSSIDDFVDIMARSFRVIAHFRFERNIFQLLKLQNAISYESLAKLIQI
ncbi:MAG: flagellin lysine-N-methylase [Candidatus Izemoplasmatales bacterium]|nr:flagellin lysine-N-methylase [Candidatus Izemoplasmatales bacterium]